MNFTSVHGDHSTPVTEDELIRRDKFKTCRLAAQTRAMDLAHLTQDQDAFLNERKTLGSAFRYSTYRGWLFGKAWSYYNSSTKQVVWPENL